MKTIPDTITDLGVTKTVYMDGEKLPGLQKCSIEYEAGEATKVVLVLNVARGSVKVDPHDIHFSTCRKEGVVEVDA